MYGFRIVFTFLGRSLCNCSSLCEALSASGVLLSPSPPVATVLGSVKCLSRASLSTERYVLFKYAWESWFHCHCDRCWKIAKKCLQGMWYYCQSLHVHEGISLEFSFPKFTTCLLPDLLDISKIPFSVHLSSIALAIYLMPLVLRSRQCNIMERGLLWR